MVQVGPSKGWYKPRISGREAWQTWQQCIAEAKEKPGYLEAKKTSGAVVIQSGMSNEDRKRMWSGNAFIGKYTCM